MLLTYVLEYRRPLLVKYDMEVPATPKRPNGRFNAVALATDDLDFSRAVLSFGISGRNPGAILNTLCG